MYFYTVRTNRCQNRLAWKLRQFGYDATLVSDAHTTEDLTEWGAPTPDKVIDHTNLYWRNHAAPGRRAAAMPTDSVSFQ